MEANPTEKIQKNKDIDNTKAKNENKFRTAHFKGHFERKFAKRANIHVILRQKMDLSRKDNLVVHFAQTISQSSST